MPSDDVPRLLHVAASPRGADSASRTVADAFLHAYAARVGELSVDTLDVWTEDLPEFDPAGIGVKYKLVSGEPMDRHEDAVRARVDALIRRVEVADALVLSTPMWNWSIPYKLKQFIDLVSQRDRLFTFDDDGYGPALDLPRALAICVRGQGRHRPSPAGTDRQYHAEYLTFWLRVIGAREVHVLDVDHTWDEQAQHTIARAVTEARELAARF